MTAAENHYGPEFSVTPVSEEIKHRFAVTFRNLGTIKKTIEKLCHRLRSLSPQDKDSCCEFLIVIKQGILKRSNILQ